MDRLSPEQLRDVEAVAEAFQRAREQGQSRTECIRAAAQAYRGLHPDEVDEAVTMAVGRIVTLLEGARGGGG